MSNFPLPTVPMTRSVSVPGAADSGIESPATNELGEERSYFASPTAVKLQRMTETSQSSNQELTMTGASTSGTTSTQSNKIPPIHPYAPSASISTSSIGHSHHSHSASYSGPSLVAHEPQTPNDFNTHHVASALLAGGNSHSTSVTSSPLHLTERRNSRPNIRLQSQAPSKLSSAAMNVPLTATLSLTPASPMTPAGFGGAPPPNTPLQMSHLDLGGEPVTPLFDQPFTPLPIPPSPLLPNPPPSSPFPSLSLNTSANPSPLMSPAASPHPIKQSMVLPAKMCGEDILDDMRQEANDDVPPPLPADPEDEDGSDQEEESIHVNIVDTSSDDDDTGSVDATNTAEFEVPAPTQITSIDGDDEVGSLAAGGEKVNVVLHRSRLGRLSIIHREDLKNKGLLALSPTGGSSVQAGSSSSSQVTPTAIGHMSEDELKKHSLTHGPTVTEVKRVQHIAFDPNEASSTAQMPPEWREALKAQFGIPATLCQSVKLQQYQSRIPLVLVRLHESLKLHKAFESQVGIFRLAPDANECQRFKQLINENVSNIDIVEDINDLNNCTANLIKVWFRDLPVALFQPIPPDSIAHFTAATPSNELESIITTYLKEPSQSIYRWLIDLACEVTKHSAVNKMVAKNVSIVIAPNLYKPPTITNKTSAADSLKIMNQCKYYTNFFEFCIGAREVELGQPRSSPAP